MKFLRITYPPQAVGHPTREYLVLMLVMLAATLFLGGCWTTVRVFDPAKNERPIVLFGRYKLDIYGQGESPYSIYCLVSLVRPLAATTKIDTIPIFIVDSFCFEGTCLDSEICYCPQTAYELEMQEYRTGDLDVKPTRLPANDLFSAGDKLVPECYIFKEIPGLSAICLGRDVSVLIHARLLDRGTGKTIAKEIKKVQFQMRKKTKLTIGD